jgi:hypothetical protein
MSDRANWLPRTWAPFGESATSHACRLSVVSPERSYFGLWYWEARSVLLGAMLGYGFAPSIEEAKAAAEASVPAEQKRSAPEAT